MGSVARLTLAVLAVLLRSPAPGGAVGDCHQQLMLHEDGSCFGFFPQELPWREAEVFCRKLGAGIHLASIHSERENYAVADLISRSQHYNVDDVWVGLHMTMNFRWEWTDGSKVQYQAWDEHEGLKKHLCVALEATTEHLTWQRNACSSAHPFVCKSMA